MATKVLGLEKLLRQLTNLNDNIEQGIEQGIAKGALRVEADAKENTPVDTGKLRASIQTSLEPTRAEVGTNVEYAPYVEMGTSKMAAQPFLYPALAADKQKILQDVKDAIKKGGVS